MSDDAGTGTNWILVGGAGGAAVVALIVWLLWGGLAPEELQTTDAEPAQTVDDATDQAVATHQLAVPAEDTAEATTSDAPRVDVDGDSAKSADAGATMSDDSTNDVSETPQVAETQVEEPTDSDTTAESDASGMTVVAREAGDADAPADPDTPSFDIVRIDPEGGALVAGKAPANATVSVRIDGQEVGNVQTDDAGSFAALFDMPKSDAAQVIELVTRDEAGAETRSADTVIVAPRQSTALDETESQAEAEAPAVLIAKDTGIEVLQPSGATATSSVVLDVISYGGDGAVHLEGRAVAGGGQVQVYLNNGFVERAPVNPANGWQMRLASVRPGVYTLRVDQVDDGGQVLSRFETPFQREDPEVLAALASDNTAGAIAASVITVQPGYTLWEIATDRYGSGPDYVQIFEANKAQITDPDLIYPGQVFNLPDEGTSPAE